MPNLLAKISANLGEAVGAYEGARFHARHRDIPFLDDMAAAKKWSGGTYNRSAQERALLNSWVFTAIRFIASEMVSAEMEIVTRESHEADPVSVSNHPLEIIMRRPNPLMGRAFLWMYTIFWMKLNGNGYWYVACNRRGLPAEFWPLPAYDVVPVPGDSEKIMECYEYSPYGKTYRIPANRIVHIRNLPNPFNIFMGMSELVAATLPADADSAMARWNGTFFGQDNVMPSLIINLSNGSSPIPFNSGDIAALKKDLRSEYQAWRRKTLITTAPGGVEVNNLGYSPRDMEFLQGRQFSKEEIFNIFGIPGGLADKDSTYANSEVADRVFKEKTLWPLLVLIAEELTAQLVIPFYGQRFEAQFKDIRPANRQQDLAEVAAGNGYLEIDEIRRKYWQLDPLPNGRGQRTATEEPRPAPGQAPAPEASAAAATADLKKWRDKALKAIKLHRPPSFTFTSDFIPPEVTEFVASLLTETADESTVKAVFDTALVIFDLGAPVSEVDGPGFFRREHESWQSYG